MRIEPVEIYSDETNRAILRHPGRQFPGVLIQGDTLKHLHDQVVRMLNDGGGALSEGTRLGLEDVRDIVVECLDHYRAVLRDHGIETAFLRMIGSSPRWGSSL